MPKKIHPADQADLDAIAQAVGFCVHMRRGPVDVFKQDAPTLSDAIVIANQVRAENKGRDCLVYAVTAEGNSIPVPKAMQRPVGLHDGGRPPKTGPAEASIDKKLSARAGVEALARVVEGMVADNPDVFSRPTRKAATAPHRAASNGSGARPVGRRAEIAENAAKGLLPPMPDFSADTHKRFRGKLAEVVKLVEAGDVAALKAFPINPYSSSPKALARYRDLAVTALEARP